jgi:hypothetical protein
MLEELVTFKKKVPIWVVVLAAFAVVLFWRGVWGLLDIYLFPENLTLSFFVSVVVGLGILYFLKRKV